MRCQFSHLAVKCFSYWLEKSHIRGWKWPFLLIYSHFQCVFLTSNLWTGNMELNHVVICLMQRNLLKNAESIEEQGTIRYQPVSGWFPIWHCKSIQDYLFNLKWNSEPCHSGTPPSTYAHTQTPATSSLPTAICHVCQLEQTTNITQQGDHYSFLFIYWAFGKDHSLWEYAAGRTGILTGIATHPHQSLCISVTTIIVVTQDNIPSS